MSDLPSLKSRSSGNERAIGDGIFANQESNIVQLFIVGKRAIVIFPQFENLHLVEQIREQFDPLFPIIPAHITLVFPIESNLSTEQLLSHIKQATQGIRPFTVKLQGITGYGGEYLFLNIKRGNDLLIELHDRLYSGALSPYRSPEITYIPHITVGRLSDRAAFRQALETAQEVSLSFQTIVSEVCVYRIGSDELDPIELRVDLE